MRIYIYYLCITLVCLNSCNNNKVQVKELESAETDTISISIGDQYTQGYTDLRNRVQGNLFYGFDNKRHSIDVFDLHGKKHVTKIEIQKEGSNGIPNVSAFAVLSDSVIIQNSAHFIIINHKGEIIKKVAKDKLDAELGSSDYTLQPTQVTLANFEDLVYDSKRNEIITPVSLKSPDKLKDKHCLASIQLDAEKVELLPVYFPETVTDKNYGKLGVPQILCKGDSLIYNFANSSHVYIFNRITKEITDHIIDSDYTKNKSEGLEENADMMKQFDYYLHALFFHGLQYDKERNQYYRIHTDKSFDPSAFNNRDTYLTIMNADFEKTSEIKLPPNSYPVFNVTKQGLMFQFMQALEENAFSYAMLTTPRIPLINTQESELLSITDIVTADTLTVAAPTTDTSKLSVKKKNVSKVDLPEKMTVDRVSEFVQENIIYPPYELENNIEGHVCIALRCDKTGKVLSCEATDHPVTTTDNKELIKEALRIGSLIKYTNTDILCFPVPFDIKRYKQRHNIE